ncbi:hypothetical protein J3Q64DRAFT_1245028 [Phycomyces blakesleeanus]|uniref:Uncharacterized protein n=1 Tax=Phycomyces blakesleeanus TaxID=4837 RepID=A0ABR3AR28_PHYBL
MPTRPDLSNRKRSRSPSPVQSASHKRHHEQPEEPQDDLLSDLTNVLAEIRTTPSTGEISAELLGTLRGVMLQIEHLSADETNTRAREMKDESDRCLETWFDELLARCEADGELDLASLGYEEMGDSEDEEDSLALALALQDEEDVCQEDEDAVSITNSTSSHSEVQDK